MRIIANDLGWVLTKVSYLSLKRFFLIPLFYFVEVDWIFIGERIKDVHIFNCIFSPLFIAIDEINPVVDVFWHVSTLKFSPQFGNKPIRVFVGPGWQDDIIDNNFLLSGSVLVVVLVDKHLWEGVDFGNQFSEICGGSNGVVPGAKIAVEYPVGDIKSTTLKSKCAYAIGSDSDEEIKNDGWRAIVRSKMILVEKLFLIFVVVLFHEISNSVFVALHSHIFCQISKMFIVVFHLLKFGHKRPRKDRVLGDISIASACNLVQPLKIFKIGHKFIDPFHRLVSIQVVTVCIFLYCNWILNYAKERLNIFLVEIEH